MLGYIILFFLLHIREELFSVNALNDYFCTIFSCNNFSSECPAIMNNGVKKIQHCIVSTVTWAAGLLFIFFAISGGQRSVSTLHGGMES